MSLDEVLTKDELKKIVGGNGSGCQDFECVCYIWTENGEIPVTYPMTACSFEEIIAMGVQMLNICESFSGCSAA